MTRARYLYTVDPGLDELVVVVWDLVLYRGLVGRCLTNLPHPRLMTAQVEVLRLKTPSEDRPAARAEAFGPPLCALIERRPPHRVVLETPANLVPYGGHTGKAVAELALSIGVAIGVLEGRSVSWEPMLPDRKPSHSAAKNVKEWRRAEVHRLCTLAGVRLERSFDVTDAQWLGVRVLSAEGPRLHRWDLPAE